jgi:two-component system OmpR family response regulator
MIKRRILIVADEATLRATLARWLLAAGYAVELAESPRRAREAMANEGAAVVLLAQSLGAVGNELARELASQVESVIFIAASADHSGPLGEPGTHACVPLSEPEVLASISVALSPARSPQPQGNPQLLRFEGYTLDAAARTCVDASGNEVTLTRAEFSLLLAFAQQPGRVLSRDDLTQVVAGRSAQPDDRSVDVLISRLRRKIEADPKTPRMIATMPGEGYKFAVKSQVTASPRPDEEDAKPKEAETQEAKVPVPRRALLLAAPAAALALIAAAVGWQVFGNRPDQRQPVELTPRTPSQVPAEEERRAAVFKRMVAAMRDDRFNWRTVERLAINAGVNEAEAHEILAEHPGEVVIGKSRDGKLIARMADR